jgi:hypothetical protein
MVPAAARARALMRRTAPRVIEWDMMDLLELDGYWTTPM